MHRQLTIMIFNKILIIGIVLTALLCSNDLSGQNQAVKKQDWV